MICIVEEDGTIRDEFSFFSNVGEVDTYETFKYKKCQELPLNIPDAQDIHNLITEQIIFESLLMEGEMAYDVTRACEAEIEALAEALSKNNLTAFYPKGPVLIHNPQEVQDE